MLTRADRGTQPGRKSGRGAGDRLHPHVDAGRSVPLAVTDDRVATGEVVAVDSHQVERDPGPGPDPLELAVGGLDPADASRAIAPLDSDRVVDRDGAAGQRAGHHRARAAWREHPVDPEPRPVAVHRCTRRHQHVVEGRAQVVEATTRHRVTHDDGRSAQ